MVNRTFLALVVILIASAPARAESTAVAMRRPSPVSVDGQLDEAAWATAPRQRGFTQRFPNDGARASLDTSFSVLYDDAAVYIGVWADDPQPQLIRRLLTRRDVDGVADSIAVGIDSYHDRRTAYVFQLNAAGVQRDLLRYDDSQLDDTWDAVWTGNSAVNGTGWTAEFRIPLNQLRYGASDAQRWGFQIARFVARTKEESSWAPWPRSGSEAVSRYGIVGGIDQLKPARRLELLPYASGGFAALPVDDADPLNDSFEGRGSIGLDLKYGLGSAFTLSATINPDFGQVEADASQVNLSGGELFFAEKRPFFLEGLDLFKLQTTNGDGNSDRMFHSRRIGAIPATIGSYTYLDAPTEATIYGAAKLTGKTRGGWSIGWLDAVTAEESARVVDGAGMETSPVVAPLTNYSALRVKRDFRGGKTSIGAVATAVNRSLDGTGLESVLHDQAYSAGTQITHRWDNDKWQADLRTFGSFVHGSEEAIARTQTAQHHLFQRPDARSFHFDPTRTSLTGGGAQWKLGPSGNTKHWRFMFGGYIRSSGLELNDIGFQNSSDASLPFLLAEYHDETPGDYILSHDHTGDVYVFLDEISSDPRVREWAYEFNGGALTKHHWRLAYNGTAAWAKWFATTLRGGPSLRGDFNGTLNFEVDSDTRKRVRFELDVNNWRNPTTNSWETGATIGATVQARSNIDLFVGPSFSYGVEAMQYVDEVVDDTGRPRYLMAQLRQATASMTVRLNWAFSPRLSLQAYAQPFLSSGRYGEYKDITNPGAKKYRDRFEPLDDRLTLADGVYTAAPGGSMPASFQFSRPDFDFRQLRSTVVLRWEYRPGSSVFAIWSHGRTSAADNGRLDLGRDLRALGETESENIVMVKANYWIGL